MITKEQKEKNFSLYIKKLQLLGINTSLLEEKLGIAIENGSFTHSNEHGNAYEGSLLEIILKTLTPYAVRLNELLPIEKRVNKDSLVKVCLLHQIAKGVKLVPNDNQWEVEKRGFVYKFNNGLPSIRNGLHSLVLAQECGIPFTVEEAEAMTVNDRALTDDQARYHSSLMATIVRQASELTYQTLTTN